MGTDSMAARLGALAGIARAAWAGSRADLLQQVAEAAYDTLDASAVSIAQWEPVARRLRVLVNYGSLAPGETTQPAAEFYLGTEYPYLDELINELRGWTANIETALPKSPEMRLLTATGMHCCAGVPIPVEGRVWGELYVARLADQACLTDLDVDLALVVAAQLGAALATADHLERIDELAHTDPLTGLANRRAADEALDSCFVHHVADRSPVSVSVCDLNGLKRINDDQGHEAGDRALIRFAALLSKTGEELPGALAARLGGDEFCIVAPDVSPDVVVAAAEELCRLVRRSPLEGVSCGVASTAEEVGVVESAARLLRLADAAQYRAKHSRTSAPVVAGRSLPADVTAHLSVPGAVTGSDRRMYRGREIPDPTRLMRAGLDLLDQLRGEGARERLTAIAEFTAQRCDAFSWAISLVDSHRRVARTEQYGHFRQREDGAPLDSGELEDEFPLDSYPLTQALVQGGGVVLEAEDAREHPEEVALLRLLGARAAVLAGVTDRSGTGWLIEIYADTVTGTLDNVATALRGLMAVAVAEAGA
jgi:diguanylate cyclase (GGDEF)-like protein